MAEAEERLIKAIERGPGQQIHIRLTTFRGREYLDLRSFYLTDDEEWKPTKKGIAVPVELYEELMAGLKEAGEALSSTPS